VIGEGMDARGQKSEVGGQMTGVGSQSMDGHELSNDRINE
jgi:hypothetical protein